MSRYLKRPAHIFGGAGVFIGIGGFAILLYLTLNKVLNNVDIESRPLFFLGILLFLLGTQLISLGLVAEMITRLTAPRTQSRILENTRSWIIGRRSGRISATWLQRTGKVH